MRFVNHILLFLISVSGLILSADAVINHRRVSTVHSLVDEALGVERSFVPPKIEEELGSVAVDSLEGGRLYFDLARLYQRIAEQRRRVEGSNLFCKALSGYGKALQAYPHNGDYLAAWANMRQLLGATECKEGVFTNGDYREVLAYALETTPVDPDIYFSAGLLHYWDGDRKRSLAYFRDFLNYTAEIKASHEQYVVSAIQSPEELLSVIPARFPHVVRWAAIFQDRKSRQFRKYSSAFAELQLKALDSLTVDYRSGELPELVYRNHLASLFAFVSNDTVRRVLDALYAEFLRDFSSAKHAEFFRSRSELSNLERVVSMRASDRRPRTSQLALWGRNERLAFDKRGVSVGFYLPAGQVLKRLELHGENGGRRVDPQQIRLYVSSDNQTWMELEVEDRVRSFIIEGYPILLIRPSESDYRYWKVHYAGPGESQFENSLDKLIRLYGVTSRRADA